MLTQSISSSASVGRKVAPLPASATDQFGTLTGHAGLIATEFSYRKDEEIYGEDEQAEYVYQVIRGAVRTYKLLSDGRRQIGAGIDAERFGLGAGDDTGGQATGDCSADDIGQIIFARRIVVRQTGDECAQNRRVRATSSAAGMPADRSTAPAPADARCPVPPESGRTARTCCSAGC